MLDDLADNGAEFEGTNDGTYIHMLTLVHRVVVRLNA
jgi:hypothetical protein